MSERPKALILGASRGLGLAVARELASRGWEVIATKRTASPELDAFAAEQPSVKIETVDIDHADAVAALRDRLGAQTLDLLLVNAGIARTITAVPANADENEFQAMMLTNALAPIRALELLEHLVARDGVLAVMSSELGSIAKGTGFWPLYSASKAALNMLMKSFAAHRPGDPRAMLLLAPGWVRTDMGGDHAPLSIAQSIPLVVDVIEAGRATPGLRFVDRAGDVLPW